jgi:hypothetical protein
MEAGFSFKLKMLDLDKRFLLTNALAYYVTCKIRTVTSFTTLHQVTNLFLKGNISPYSNKNTRRFSYTNALAYYGTLKITTVKSFTTLL